MHAISRYFRLRRVFKSELVGIVASQMELEQLEYHQTQGEDESRGANNVDVITEPGEKEEEDQDEDKREGGGGGGCSDHEWTRGPVRLEYDSSDPDDDVYMNENRAVGATVDNAESENGAEGDEDRESGSRDSPLRLRGGVGLPRTKTLKAPAQTTYYRAASSEARPASALPSLSSVERGGATTADKSSAMSAGNQNKRPAPPPHHGDGAQQSGSAQASKRQMSLVRAPGGLRRSTSVTGGFRPPRPAGESRDVADGVDSEQLTMLRVGVAEEQRVSLERAVGDTESETFAGKGPFHIGDNFAVEEGSNEENSDRVDRSESDERSQVTVPGWDSQGYHPVEYAESQLSFVSTSQLRTSPNAFRGRTSTVLEAEDKCTLSGSKRQKLLGDGMRSCITGNENISGFRDARTLGHDGDISGGAAAADGKSETPPAKGSYLGGLMTSRLDTPSSNEDYRFDFDRTQEDEQVPKFVSRAAPAAPAVRAVSEAKKAPFDTLVTGDEEEKRKRGGDDEETDEGETAETTMDVESRWASADARLRRAQARGTPPPAFRSQQRHKTVGGRGRDRDSASSSPLGPDVTVSVRDARYSHELLVSSPSKEGGDKDQVSRSISEADSPSSLEDLSATQEEHAQGSVRDDPLSPVESCGGSSSATVAEQLQEYVAEAAVLDSVSSPHTGGNVDILAPATTSLYSPALLPASTSCVDMLENAGASPTNAPPAREEGGAADGSQHDYIGGGNGQDQDRRAEDDRARQRSASQLDQSTLVDATPLPRGQVPTLQSGNKRGYSDAHPRSSVGATPPITLNITVPSREALPKSPTLQPQRQHHPRNHDSNDGQTSIGTPKNHQPTPPTDLVAAGAAAAAAASSSPIPSSFPTPTSSSSPPALDWGRSPPLHLSGNSDLYDMVPLGQRSPGLPITAAPIPSRTEARNEGRGKGGGLSAEDRSPTGLLTSGSGAAGSPDDGERVFSGFTPPTPRQRRGGLRYGKGRRGGGVVVLRPREKAPDPRESAVALARLGVPQVVCGGRVVQCSWCGSYSSGAHHEVCGPVQRQRVRFSFSFNAVVLTS